MSKEIELKLALPANAHAALRRHPLIQAAPRQGTGHTLVNTYFDTADLALQAERIALRTRKQGRLWLQTVKCAATSVAGLSSRPEWETPWKGAFDFDAVDLPAIRKCLERHRDKLVPLFTTTFRRDTRLYAPAEGVRILIMVDRGEVSSGAARAPISEVELELVEGCPADLLALARELAQTLPLWPEDVSKAERGYRLYLNQPRQPMRALPSRIAAAQAPHQAFRSLAEDSLRQWQSNADGAFASSDPEYVHQMRVALRRLRSALRLFAPALPPDFVTAWSVRCGEAAAALGAVRDLDAMEAAVLAPVLAPASADGVSMEGLVLTLARRRDAARAATRSALDPATQGRLMLALMADLHALQEAPDGAATALAGFAAERLDLLLKKARSRRRRAASGDPLHLHTLRIALKRLRYGLDFFAPLLPARNTSQYARALAEAQDQLGYLHDLDVARESFVTWIGADHSQALALGYLFGWHAQRRDSVRDAVLDAVETLLDGKPPWKALR